MLGSSLDCIVVMSYLATLLDPGSNPIFGPGQGNHCFYIFLSKSTHAWDFELSLVTQQLIKNVFKTFQNCWVSIEMWGFLKVVSHILDKQTEKLRRN